MVGLPSSGKTTFIAALWYYLTLGDRLLTLDTLQNGDHQYLNKIRDEWLEYRLVTRTLLKDQKNQEILMRLKMRQSDRSVVLDIPDFSGETYKEQFRNREWSHEFDDKLGNLSGIVLFVTSLDRNSMPRFLGPIRQLEALLGSEENETNNASNENTSGSTPPAEFHHDYVATQAKLVDLLQLIQNRLKRKSPLNMSIVVSAWDKIIEEVEEGQITVTPEFWFQQNFPLLHQYIHCNGDLFNVVVFGVSAQGGTYDNDNELNKLLKKNFDDRIIVQDGNSISNDITKPIAQLLS